MPPSIIFKNAAGQVLGREPFPADSTPDDKVQAAERLRTRLLAAAMGRVEAVVAERFPEALDPVKAALAVTAVGCLADNMQPTSLIDIAPSGAGKTLVLSWLLPADDADPLNAYIYRADNLTAASFVSHRVDLKKQELSEIDLLPKIKNKTIVTKELAPLFRGKYEELIDKFARLTTVLDGQGYVSNTGAQGRRGYGEAVNFQWLGASTPLSPEMIAVMAQLGPRLLFYNAERPRKSVDELAAYGRRGDEQAARAACRAAVRDFLLLLYQLRPPRSIASESVAVDETSNRALALWADVLTRLRAELPKNDEAVAPPLEHAERVLGMLRNVAIGSALVHGRSHVDGYDLAQVGHIALSSGVSGRGQVFGALLRLGGHGTTPEIMKATGLSKPTALRYIRELAAVGLASFEEGIGPTPAHAGLIEPYTDLLGENRVEVRDPDTQARLGAIRVRGVTTPAQIGRWAAEAVGMLRARRVAASQPSDPAHDDVAEMFDEADAGAA